MSISYAILIGGFAVFIGVLYKSISNPKYRDDTVEILKQIFIGAAGGLLVATPFISPKQIAIMTGIYLVFLALLVWVLTRLFRVR